MSVTDSKMDVSKYYKIPAMERSLKPLLVCLWMLGIPFHLPGGRNNKTLFLIYTLTWIWGLLLFCLNVWVNVSDLWKVVTSGIQAVSGWNAVIKRFSLCLALISVHLGWLAIATPKWINHFLGTLQRMRKFQLFYNNSPGGFFRISIIGTTVIVMVGRLL